MKLNKIKSNIKNHFIKASVQIPEELVKSLKFYCKKILKHLIQFFFYHQDKRELFFR